MRRLLIAELRRVAARRLVRVTVVVACLGIAIGGVVAFVTSGSVTETDVPATGAGGRRPAASPAGGDPDVPARNGVGRERGKIPDDVAQQCFRLPDLPPTTRAFTGRRLKGVLQGVSGVLAIIGWALGASLVGAEFASRSMTTLLTWEPRRSVCSSPRASRRCSPPHSSRSSCSCSWPSPWCRRSSPTAHRCDRERPEVASLAGIVGSGAALAALAAGMGFAIATIGRNTAAALGAGFAYIIILENILGSSVERWRRWLLLGNVIVFVSGRITVVTFPAVP